MNIVLLGAGFNTNNMGVAALAAGTVRAALSRYPNAEISLLDYGKESLTHQLRVGDRNVVVQLINIRFSKKLFLQNNIARLIALAWIIKAIPSMRIKAKIIGRNVPLAQLDRADIVGAISGGDSFSDIYGLSRLLYVCLPQLLALALGKRLILLPQTIGPFKSAVSRAIARAILTRAEIIFSRDQEGVTETQELMGSADKEQKVKFCYDVGFVLEPVRPNELGLEIDVRKERMANVVGLNVSGLLYMGGYSRNNMFGLKLDYKNLIPDLIDVMIRKHDSAVILIPHVFGSHAESDSVVCQRIFSSLKERYGEKLMMASGKYDQSGIKYIIGLCDFFIGSRMHACIAALSQHIPTVSIAYSKKFIGVMRTIGVSELVADPRQLGQEEILRVIGEAFEQKARLKTHLEKVMPEVKGKVLGLFGEIGRARRGTS